MSTKHTPGPWLLHPCDEALVTINRRPFPQHMSVLGHSQVADAEDYANAQLIAAAPELLEACQAAWNCIAELTPTQARVEVAQLLQGAVEKATGAAP